MNGLELVVSVASPQELAGTDLAPYDAVCLGNPYCRRTEGNYAEDLALLPEAVAGLHARGKRAYLTTPAAPRGRDLPHVQRLIETAAAAGVDALEVHNLGVLRMLREKGSPLPAHMGAFANVYTAQAAAVMRGHGAVRVRPNAEVSLAEAATIAVEADVEVELLVHGKIPLGVTDGCFLLEGPEETDLKCPSACREEQWMTTRHAAVGSAEGEKGPALRSAKREGGWILKTVGKGVLSGKDMCMLEHLPDLLSRGFRVFRVDALYESSAWRSEIGAVYREAIGLCSSGGAFGLRAEWKETVRRHAPKGICNGYYFGKAGRTYVGTVLQG